MKKVLPLFLFFLIFCSCGGQGNANDNVLVGKQNETNSRPKLVVGIVVDQMRYDYLTRFESKFGEGGFKRLINEGFNCKNHHFNYIPTKTGPGHASIYTGTIPKYHGIIGNNWYQLDLRKKVNCVEDESVEPLGTLSEDGKKSPVKMLTSTFADENRLFTEMRGKSIGISIKHRGAILPVGHSANAAYWWDYDHNGNGNWITSSYYMNELPQWVVDFNNSGKADSYFKVWDTYYNIDHYIESGSDINEYERLFKGETNSGFPHDLKSLKDENGGYKVIADSPYGNSLTTDFVIEALIQEKLGKDNYTDVLTISYSSTDKVGHDFAPNSVEVEDTYIRLDLELERLFKELDERVGKAHYTVFLTSDHGAPHAPMYTNSLKIPAGFFNLDNLLKKININLEESYGVPNLALSRINNQIYIDHKSAVAHKLSIQELKTKIAQIVKSHDLISNVYITSELNNLNISLGYQELLLFNGHHQMRSGDVIFTFNPEVFKDTLWNRTGTDHHSGYNYDTHVPLIFSGVGIKKGETLKRTVVTDITPTISALLGISFPNGATGNVLDFVLD